MANETNDSWLQHDVRPFAPGLDHESAIRATLKNVSRTLVAIATLISFACTTLWGRECKSRRKSCQIFHVCLHLPFSKLQIKRIEAIAL
jgi:hypothetical protein